jgi:hypothetical protein
MRDGISTLSGVRDPPICVGVGSIPVKIAAIQMRTFCALRSWRGHGSPVTSERIAITIAEGSGTR